jgi:hypothetical protein
MTASVTGTGAYARAGNLVQILLPDLSGTSNATTLTVTGIPAALTPTRTVRTWAALSDNGVFLTGVARMNAGVTTVTLFTSLAGAGFVASGTKGVFSLGLQYPLV